MRYIASLFSSEEMFSSMLFLEPAVGDDECTHTSFFRKGDNIGISTYYLFNFVVIVVAVDDEYVELINHHERESNVR